MQYFERAVFESHPENQPPFDVLLSQLGTFQYRCKYQGGTCAGGATPTATPPPAPAATATPGPGPSADCSGIPASQNQVVTPVCGPRGTVFHFTGSGFHPGESVGIYATKPSGGVFGAPFQAQADTNGTVTGITLTSNSTSELGVWAMSMEGTDSHIKAIGYFKITGTAPPPSGGCDVSADKDGTATPSSAHVGETINFTARGFSPGEDVSFWFTTPGGLVVGTRAPAGGFVNPDGTIGPLPITIDSFFSSQPGRWAITFQGASSTHQSVIYFCVSP